MKNYVQTRVAPTSKSRKSINHDLRVTKPNYLRNNLYHNQFENVYSSSNYVNLRAVAKSYEQEFKELYKKRTGRNPQSGKASAFMEGVITLSNSINELLEKGDLTPQELNSLFVKALENQLDKIKEITGTRPKLIEYSIHYDEKTPHLHYLVTNFDHEGRSLHHALKTSKRMSQLQDQVGKDFAEIGFVRGEKKEFKRPLKIVEMHEKEKEQLKEQVKAYRQELQKYIKALKEHKKELKKTIEDKKELREQLEIYDLKLKNARRELKGVKLEVLELESKENLLKSNLELLNERIEELQDEEYELLKRDIRESTERVLKKSTSTVPDTDDWRSQLCTVPDEDDKKTRKYR